MILTFLKFEISKQSSGLSLNYNSSLTPVEVCINIDVQPLKKYLLKVETSEILIMDKIMLIVNFWFKANFFLVFSSFIATLQCTIMIYLNYAYMDFELLMNVRFLYDIDQSCSVQKDKTCSR